MIKCDNCGEEIDGPAYANPSEPSENLCRNCYGHMPSGQIPERCHQF
jgi:hypothetical protein